MKLVRKSRSYTVEVYRSASDHDWRWRVRSSNGRTVADSAEGYTNKVSVIVMADKLFPHIPLKVVR